MGETNSPSVAWRNIVTHGQLKENLYIINQKSEHVARAFMCYAYHVKEARHKTYKEDFHIAQHFPIFFSR